MNGKFEIIAIASDHAAVRERKLLIERLKEWGILVLDEGPESEDPMFQFSDVAEQVALKVVNDSSGKTGGILMCGNGVGMSVAANKVPGARAAVCNELFTAQYAKRDAHLNILCVGARVVAPRLMEEITKVWLNQEYEGGRFDRRLALMEKMEAKYIKR